MKGGVFMKNHVKIVSLAIICSLILPVTALAAYIGNVQTYKFHHSGCRWENKIKAGNRVIFEKRVDAVNRRMKPCGVCKP